MYIGGQRNGSLVAENVDAVTVSLPKDYMPRLDPDLP